MQTKAAVKQVLRESRTLELADRVRRSYLQVRLSGVNRRFRLDHPGFAVPPASLSFDAYGHVRSDWYYETGSATAGYVASLLSAHAAAPAGEPLRILDWGCGAGRVIRHMPQLFDPPADLSGSDYNPRSVEWCRRNIAGVRFELNALEPPLAFGDASFDCIYALSVFTHLSEQMHYAWRDELLRVLRPGGVLLLSVNGEHYARLQLPPGDLERFHAGACIVHAGIEEGRKWFTAYQSERFVEQELLGGMTVLEHIARPELAGFHQEIWMVRR